MKKILLIILMIFSMQTFAQLYHGVKGRWEFYVEINQDRVLVDQFNLDPHGRLISATNEEILTNRNQDTLFIGNRYRLEKKNGTFQLSCILNDGKTLSVGLDTCRFDYRLQHRKNEYSNVQQNRISMLEDSLSGPDFLINVNLYHPIFSAYHDTLSEKEYKEKVDRVSDSLVSVIQILHNPMIDSFYVKIDSIQYLDSTAIYSLLSKADYDFHYGRFLLERVAFQRSECLIGYIDSNPLNKKKLLMSIRNHRSYKGMIEKVKAASPETDGKNLIVKQKRKRVTHDVVLNITAGITVSAIVISEVALVVMLFAWIF